MLFVAQLAFGQLSGTYTVGGTSPTYSTISEACDSLNQYGVSGPVIINIRSGTYSEQFELDSIQGLSTTNTIMFQGDPANASNPEISHTSGGNNYVLRIKDVSYVTVKNLNFQRIGGVIEIRGVTDKITIDSCRVEGSPNSLSSSDKNIYCFPTGGELHTDLTIKNCEIIYGNNGIYLWANDTNNLTVRNVTINNNNFLDGRATSLILRNFDSARVNNNVIRNLDQIMLTGIRFNGGKNLLECANNRIYADSNVSTAYIGISNVSNNSGDYGLIFNNEIFHLDTNTASAYGISLIGSSRMKIYHNSIHSTTTSSFGGGILVNSSSQDIHITNNIFECTSNNPQIAYYHSNTNITANYNCYYNPNGNGPNRSASVAAYFSTSGQDSNSISVDPTFTSDSNLVPTNIDMDNKGTPLTEVPTDADGQTRNVSTPDIGAFEFTGVIVPLNGEYTVGGSSPDYDSLSLAIDALNLRGVSGDVTFNIRPGTYDDQYKIDSVQIDNGYEVLFQRDPDSTGVVTLKSNGSTSSSNYVIWLYNTSNISFKNIQFSRGSSTHNILIYLSGNNDSILVDSCELLGGSSRVLLAGNILNDFTLSNSLITKNVGYVIYIKDGVRNKFLYNRFEGFGKGGGKCFEFDSNSNDSLQIIGNYIESTTDSTVETNRKMYGIELNYAGDGGIMSDNEIYLHVDGMRDAYGIFARPDEMTISNNSILVEGSVSRIAHGMHNYPCRSSDFDYNTIVVNATNFSGDTLAANENEVFRCLTPGGGNNIRNNNLVNLQNRKVISITTNTTTSNYNNLYGDGFDLSSWQSGGYDSNSYSIDPKFTSDTVLSMNVEVLDTAAQPIAGITTDITGKTRSASTPSIGAYEYVYTCLGLSGTKTIGGSSPDYATITAAANDLNAKGICGDVTFLIRQGTYAEHPVFNSYINEGIGMVTIRNDPANTADVIIKDSLTKDNPGLFTFNNTGYFKIIGLNFESTDASVNTPSQIRMEEHCSVFYIDSCDFKSSNINNVFYFNSAVGTGESHTEVSTGYPGGMVYYTERVELSNSSFDGFGYPINISGESSSGMSPSIAVGKVWNCTITNNEGYAFFRGKLDSLEYRNNSISGKRAVLQLVSNSNMLIEKNTVTTESDGNPPVIQALFNAASAGNPIAVRNNVFSHTNTSTTSNPIAMIDIRIDNYWDFYNNTFFLDGADGDTVSHRIFYIRENSNHFNIKNNNLYNRGSGAVFDITTPSSSNFNLDYNNVFAGSGDLAQIDGTTFSSLDSLNALGFDSNSVSINPLFNNDTLLEPHVVELESAGLVIAGITDDILGNSRDTTPSIGAYEYTYSCGGLSGNFTIGGSSPDYTTITQAVADLNNLGICSSVTFDIRQGTYNDRIDLDEIYNLVDSGAVTFQADPANTSDVIIRDTITAAEEGLLVFHDQGYASFKGLNFEGYTTETITGLVAFNSEGEVENVRFEDCEFTMTGSVFTFHQGSGSIDSLFIDNCYTDGRLDLRQSQSDTSYASVSNSTFTKKGQSFLASFAVMDVYNNEMGYEYGTTNAWTGLVVINSDNLNFYNNEIVHSTAASLYGTGFTSFSGKAGKINIYNNVIDFLHTYTGTSFSVLQGISVSVGANDTTAIYNNTIRCDRTVDHGDGVGLRLNTNGIFYVHNNIVTVGGNALPIQCSATLISDHNNFHALSDTIAEINGTKYTSILALNATGNDSNSFSVDPYFISDTLLRPYRAILDNKANASFAPSLDFLDVSRASSPDIGAFQFQGIQFDVSIDSIKIDTLCVGQHTISVLVKNQGDSVVSNFNLKTSDRIVGGSYSLTDEITYSGSLNKGDSVWVNCGSIDMQTGIFYDIKALVDTINGYLDDDPSNNNPKVTLTPNARPTASFSGVVACDGDSLKLEGAGGANYQWFGPNSFTDTLQVAERANINSTYSGSYTLVVHDTNFCVDTAIQVISVDTAPQANLPNDSAICIGQNLTITATVEPSYSYAWNNLETSPFVTLNQAGEYWVKITDQNGCASSDTFNLDTLSLPTVSITSSVGLVCTNSPSRVINIGSPLGGVYISTLTVGDTLIPSVAGTFPLTYSFTDTNGCVSSEDTVVNILAAPSVVITAIADLCINSDIDSLTEHTPKGGTFFGTSAITGTAYDPSTYSSNTLDTIGYTYQSANGCRDTAFQTVTVHDTLAISLTDTSYCENQGVVQLEQPSSVYAGYQGSYSGSASLIGNFYNPGATANSADTVTFSVSDSNSCISTTTRIIGIDTIPIVAFNDTDYCINSGIITLASATPSGGVYYGTGISGDSLDPTIPGLGQVSLYYAYQASGNGCSDTIESKTFINPIPIVSLSLPDSTKERCIDDIPVTLSGQSPLGVTGVFTGTGVSFNGTQFLADSAGAGTHQISYTYTDLNGCSDVKMDSIVVHQLPNVSISVLDSICINAAPDTLIGGLHGTPLGGFFTGNGVTSNELFDPQIAGVGDLKLVTYNFVDTTTQCFNSATDTVHVDSVNAISLGLIPDYCINVAIDTLNQGSLNSGNFSYKGSGIQNNNEFNPVLAGVGAHTIQYVYTNQHGCSDSLSQVVQVYDTTAVSLNIPPSFASICDNEAPFSMSYGSPLGGSYNNVVGLSNNKFDPSVAGVGNHTLIYTYANSNNCVTSAQQTVTVNISPTVTVLPDSFCLNEGPQLLAGGNPSGGNYTGPGMVNDSIFNPLIAGTGSVLLRYTYTIPSTGCTNSADTTIVVNSVPIVSLSPLTSACKNKADFSLNAGASTADSSYYAGRGIANGATGLFSPFVADTGNHEIYYVGLNKTGCVDTALQNIRIDSVPNVYLDTIADLCDGASTFRLTVGNPSANGTGIYSGKGVSGSFYYPSVSGIGVDQMIYQFTDLNGCSSSDTESVVINPLPSITAATWSSVCVGEDSIALSGALPAGGVYSSTLFVDSATQKFAPDSVGVWVIQYDYTDTNQCSNSSTQSIRVRALPSVSLNFPSQFCENANSISLAGGSPIGPSGVYKGAGVRGADYITDSVNATTDTLWYVFTDAFGCLDSASQAIVIDTLTPIAKVGLPDICEGSANLDLEPYYLPAGGQISGIGIFGNQLFTSLLNPGEYPIVYNYTDSNNCKNQLNDTIYLRANPVLQLNDDTAMCTGETIELKASGGLSYQWNTGEHSSSILVSPDSSETYSVEVKNAFDCASNDQVLVTVHKNFRVFTNSSPANCGASDGSGFVTVIEGKAPIQYYWSDGERNATNSGLFAGTYTITVVDDNQCEQYVSLDVSNTDGPSVQLDSIRQLQCFGDANGGIYLTVNNAISSVWSNGETSSSLTNLSQGLYSFIALDSAGCSTAKSFEIETPDEIEVEFALTAPECDSSNGRIIADVTGGAGNFSYSWIGQGSTSDSLNSVSAGAYALQVQDIDGCIDTFVVKLNNLSQPNYRLDSIIHVDCGSVNGGVFISSTDSIRSYKWSNGPTTAQNTNLNVGTYIMTITDTSGCVAVDEYTVDYLDPQQTSICYVTYDSSTGFNLIKWDTSGVSGIAGYDIYRETSIKGNYNKLAQVSPGANPVYVDSSLNATLSVGNYVVGTSNACVSAKNLQQVHKSILLTAKEVNADITQLNWTGYEGITVTGYRIFRYATDEGFRLLDTVSAISRSYIDYSAPQEQKKLFYFVMARGNDVCTPEGAIVSNFSTDFGTGVFVGMQPTEQNMEFQLYPNPNKGEFNLVFNENIEEPILMSIYNSQGEIVYEKTIVAFGREAYSIKLFDISDGMYYLQLVGNGKVATTPVIINR